MVDWLSQEKDYTAGDVRKQIPIIQARPEFKFMTDAILNAIKGQPDSEIMDLANVEAMIIAVKTSKNLVAPKPVEPTPEKIVNTRPKEAMRIVIFQVAETKWRVVMNRRGTKILWQIEDLDGPDDAPWSTREPEMSNPEFTKRALEVLAAAALR